MSGLRQTLEFEVLCALDKPAQTVVRRFNVDCTCPNRTTAARPGRVACDGGPLPVALRRDA